MDDLKKCEVTLLPSVDKRQCGLVIMGWGGCCLLVTEILALNPGFTIYWLCDSY